jgi:hypothetical protein
LVDRIDKNLLEKIPCSVLIANLSNEKDESEKEKKERRKCHTSRHRSRRIKPIITAIAIFKMEPASIKHPTTAKRILFQ